MIFLVLLFPDFFLFFRRGEGEKAAGGAPPGEFSPKPLPAARPLLAPFTPTTPNPYLPLLSSHMPDDDASL
jgi:hypothetical protein